ncbi:limb region 1 protein homolog isoform X3 [Suricata suricatta]|uniref:limb region 1 protein homolog isoform X3 n=1 Tax=Suricata suricatta TaxID=37032 RepID=UPI00115597D8|nr:limb region 1 protein homolog isoform X3 [Suricata suricatta]
MPFAFFFLESEGFAGLKKGIRARILETLVMLILLALLILGIVWVASALIDQDAASMESLYDLWEFYLPYLYSCISLMGCLLLLLCTPVGLSRMFTVMGQLLVKPAILEDLDEQIYIITLEEEALQRRLNERRKKASAWERNLVYPAVMVLLLTETFISVLLVACNILCLLVDETAMPKGTRGPGIGNASLSAFGFVGAALEIILIFYLMVSSVVGFYSLRFFGNFIPKKDDTTMTKIIGNCVSILVLSSALPVMSRTLGITRFDLLGDFGRFNWLGNFYIVLSYNLLFAIVTTLCLVRKFTSAVREELFKALECPTLCFVPSKSLKSCVCPARFPWAWPHFRDPTSTSGSFVRHLPTCVGSSRGPCAGRGRGGRRPPALLLPPPRHGAADTSCRLIWKP